MGPRTSPFRMVSEFAPAGDQPGAIAALGAGIGNGERYQTLLGITGSGKSATIAWTIEQVQKPTLVIAPNKSLAAQLANEFREFFPDNRVEYFVSYYDYYQPEAYIPSSDTYIEKDSSINDEIERLRHSSTAALLARQDVIVVASVSCIYGLGSPEQYGEQIQRPTLVIAPNKSLAAQLANEFREFFPDNRVEYFVSYYDYYQPEAYIASSDTYIEKDSSVNDEIDRLRHSATSALLTRRDVIVVASVSCIYGLGSLE